MPSKENYHPSDFETKNYRRLLQIAKERFNFRTYTQFSKHEQFILWRHDVDFSVHRAKKLAQIESEERVHSTFFFHMHSEFYNLMEDIELFHNRATARKYAYNRIDMEYRQYTDSKYSVIGLMGMDSKGIKIRCHASKEALKDKPREQFIALHNRMTTTSLEGAK